MGSGCTYRIRVDERLGCIAVRWFGTFSAETCRRFFDELAQLPYFRKCARLIHDGRQCDLSIDSAEIFRAARLPYVEADRDEPLRVAIVVGSELGYGMMRIMSTTRSRDDVRIHIFRSYGEAAEWLDLPPHGGEVFDEF